MPKNQEWWYYRVIKGSDHELYRLISKPGYSRVDAFSVDKKEWTPVLSCDMVLYDISEPEAGMFFLGSRHGLIEVDVKTEPSSLGSVGKLPKSTTSPYNTRLLVGFRVFTPRGVENITDRAGTDEVIRDWQGGWWLGMGHLGVFYYHPSRYNFFAGTAEECGIPEYKLEESHERVKNLWSYRQQPDNDLVTDSQGREWHATHNGIIVKHGDDSVTVTTKDGLPSNYILTLCVDKNDRVWAATSNGISNIDITPSGINVNNYSLDDGIPQWKINERSAVMLDDCRIAIGCVEGWITFDPDKVKRPHYPLKPVLCNVEVLGVDSLSSAPYFTESLNLSYLQNDISLYFSTLNYAFPNAVKYQWRLKGGNNEQWHNSAEQVDANGCLRLSFMNLIPGRYLLEVMASDDANNFDGDTYTLAIIISPPWWQTWWAYTLYTILALALTALAVWGYMRHKQNMLKQQHREEMLLQQIQQLMQNAVPTTDLEDEKIEEDEQATNPEEMAFVQNAITLVESHLAEPYSVEQLAKDLCMERTGLYKRLTTFVKQSPQTFIRSIRLNHAAKMLKNGATVTETSEATGFNSVSYFSRAFTKEFGVTPSEYAALD